MTQSQQMANRDAKERKRGVAGTVPASAAVVCAAILFAAGLMYLFALRFNAGDIYPPYSSLRTDPLGCKALFESLDLAGFRVERNFKDLAGMRLPADSAVLFLGDRPAYDPNMDCAPSDVAAALNSLARNGGRIVITFLPRNWAGTVRPTREADKDRDDGKADEKDGRRRSSRDDDPEWKLWMKRTTTLTNWLGLAFSDTPYHGTARAVLAGSYQRPELPASISCHTSLHFTDIGSEWRTVYERAGKPVIIEKELGKGAVVLSTISYFASNEAMKDERHPGLLAWLVGNRRNVVFDETHLGVSGSVGVGSLVRKYGLQWSALCAVVLAGLFVWRGSFSIVPRGAAGRQADVATGKGSAAGLVNILRRNVPAGLVLGVCVAEWRKSLGRTTRADELKLARVQRLVEDGASARRAETEVYNSICETVKQRGALGAAGKGE